MRRSVAQIVTLVFLSLLFAFSVVIALVALRFDHTVYSYRFMSNEMERALTGFGDTAVSDSTMRIVQQTIGRELSGQVPAQLRPAINEALSDVFTAQWAGSILRRWLPALFRYARRLDDQLALPFNLASLKNAFANNVRALTSDTRVLREVDVGINNLPNSIDILEVLDATTRDGVLHWVRFARVVSFMVQYVVTGLLIVACFAFRRLGSGSVAVGAGLTLGGLVTAVAIKVVETSLATSIGAAVTAAAIGGNLLSTATGQWMTSTVAGFVTRFVTGAMPATLVVIAVGVLIIAIGIVVTRRFGDEPLTLK